MVITMLAVILAAIVLTILFMLLSIVVYLMMKAIALITSVAQFVIENSGLLFQTMFSIFSDGIRYAYYIDKLKQALNHAR